MKPATQAFLRKKYGDYVYDQLVSDDSCVQRHRKNKDGTFQQNKVLEHLRSMKDSTGRELVPQEFFRCNAEWPEQAVEM
jgi:hypothetical protein